MAQYYMTVEDILREAKQIGALVSRRSLFRYIEEGMLPLGKKISGRGNVSYFPADAHKQLWLVQVLTKMNVPEALIKSVDLSELAIKVESQLEHGFFITHHRVDYREGLEPMITGLSYKLADQIKVLNTFYSLLSRNHNKKGVPHDDPALALNYPKIQIALEKKGKKKKGWKKK